MEGERGYAFLRAAGAALADIPQKERRILMSGDETGAPVGRVTARDLSDDGRVAGGALFVSERGDEGRSVRRFALSSFEPWAGRGQARVGDIALSGEGRHVVFSVDFPPDGRSFERPQTFLYRLHTDAGALEPVSVRDGIPSGVVAGTGSIEYLFYYDRVGFDVSGDGRYVAFSADWDWDPVPDVWSHHVQGPVMVGTDVFLRDMATGETLNVTDAFTYSDPFYQGDVALDSLQPSISRDGRTIAFTSNGYPGWHVARDINALNDVYVARIEDMAVAELRRVSETEQGASAGSAGNARLSRGDRIVRGESFAPALAPDGSAVAFVTRGADVFTGVGDDAPRLLARDLTTGAFLEAPDFFHPAENRGRTFGQ